MIDPERERELLRDYTAALEEAKERLAQGQRDVDSLKRIVDGLYERVGPTAEGTESVAMAASPSELPLAQEGPADRMTISDGVRHVLGDGRQHSTDEIVAFVGGHEDFVSNPPKRVSITNRLNLMEKAGEVVKVARGMYQLPPSVGEEGAG